MSAAEGISIETIRPDGARQSFAMVARAGYLESVDEIPEPHAFTARITLDRGGEVHSIDFQEHEHAHGAAERDNNMRSAVVHVLADAGVSILVIVGLLLGRFLGLAWMDPVVGSSAPSSSPFGRIRLIRDTGAILLE